MGQVKKNTHEKVQCQHKFAMRDNEKHDTSRYLPQFNTLARK